MATNVVLGPLNPHLLVTLLKTTQHKTLLSKTVMMALVLALSCQLITLSARDPTFLTLQLYTHPLLYQLRTNRPLRLLLQDHHLWVSFPMPLFLQQSRLIHLSLHHLSQLSGCQSRTLCLSL